MTSRQLMDLPVGGALLTEIEAAAALGLKNHNTLAIWRCTKRYQELVYVKIGRNVRYPVEAIERFKRARAVGVL